MLVASQLPELNKFFGDYVTAFAVYLTLTQVCFAILVFKLVQWPWFRWCGMLWFMTQAMDEATGQNVWPEDDWTEYWAFATLAIIATIGHKLSHEVTGSPRNP